jgi:prepilin-type N-terminal cleavage/methylation domain-containing protein
MRNGFTLVDLLLALAVAGIVLLIALPRVSDMHDGLLVEQAAWEIAAAHTRARITAVVEDRVAVLSVGADSLRLRVIDGIDTIPRWSGPGPRGTGVQLGGGVRQVVFAPMGLSFGLSNATYTLTRGSRTRQVVVSRYGRVRVQ